MLTPYAARDSDYHDYCYDDENNDKEENAWPKNRLEKIADAAFATNAT
jgi:hypothetical protein